MDYGQKLKYEVKDVLMMDLFLTNTQLWSSPDVNWWSGVDYCDVIISCLDSHSDGTHSLQSVRCWASDAMLYFSKSDEETNSSTSWMIWGRGHVQLISILGWSISISEMLCWHSRARSETLVPLLEGWWRCYSLQSRLIHSRCDFLQTQETCDFKSHSSYVIIFAASR